MLGARREHPVRLEAALRDQIVDEDADVRLVAAAARTPLVAATRARRIDAGHEALRRGLFVARRAVDLSGEKQPGDALRLERARQLGRLDEVVFDGVAGPQQHRVFEARQRVHEIRLHVARQAHREAVDVDLARVEPFRLEKNLVPLLVGEADDLVLERRTVARTDAAESVR